jgi:FkbM family methyltransferase
VLSEEKNVNKPLARIIRKYFGDIKFRKKLPKEFGSASVVLVPKADMRGLYPGWDKIAPGLAAVAREYVLKNEAQDDPVIWDIGSNQGIFSVMAAGALGGRGTVLSVEADPFFACLQEKTLSKLPEHYSNITVLCAAVADTSGILNFQISSYGHARSHLESVRETHDSTRKLVASTTLDVLLEEHGEPNLVKIDVEGAELLCLQGTTHLLSHVRPIFYIEVSEENSAEVTEIFVQNHYDIFKLHLDKPPSPISRAEMYTIALPSPDVRLSAH